MWTDLFKPGGTKTSKPGVDRVDRADSLPTAPPARASARFGQVAKRVDRVDSRLSDPTENTGLNSASSPQGDVPEAVPPGAAMPTASTSSAPTQSTHSTRSTQGKCCALLTAAEKKVLLALFEPDVVTVDVMARTRDHERAQELRRTINVVWRLITVEGWDFDAAAMAAAEWVVAQPVHPDELFFADVLTFSRGHHER